MIRLTENKAKANEIREAINSNDGYCPSKKKKLKDTKCMCREFREMREGECPCGLYVKEA